MEANRKRNIRSGEEYNHLFPKSEGSNKTIRKNADVTHTVAFIPKVVHETLHHTKALANQLKAASTYETCENIWRFVYQHIAYIKDQEGYEQIRSPARAWHDRKTGVDCDCYSVFISSILTNLNVPHILRITKYHRDYFQHIYPLVVLSEKEIVIDCVTDQFNYQVPFSEKKDYPMDLQYLNGFDSMGELGKVRKGATRKAFPVAKKKSSLLTKVKAKKATLPNGAKPKKGGFFKKALNTVNRVNPATVLLRNGILAAMKLNIKNIAKRLRWSYLTPEGAAQKGIDPQKFGRLIATRQKLEKIFYGAGGNPKNLKKAMLGGKGNKDKAVAGLDGSPLTGIDYMSAYTPLPRLLGPEIYQSENGEGVEGLGQLGEPVTLVSVGAAMGVLAGIVAALKQIGDIFPKNSKGSQDFDEKANEAAENNLPIPGTTALPLSDDNPTTPIVIARQPIEESFKQEGTDNEGNSALVRTGNNESLLTSNRTEVVLTNEAATGEEEDSSILPVSKRSSSSAGVNPPPTPGESYWDKNKSWIKPVAIGVGGVSLIAIGFAVLSPKHTAHKSSSTRSLSGVPASKKGKRGHHRKSKTPKTKHHTKTAVALL